MSDSLTRYAVVFEQSRTGYAAYVPDLPGCIASGDSIEDAERLIGEAIAFHIEGLREDGLPVPPPTSRCEYVTSRVAS